MCFPALIIRDFWLVKHTLADGSRICPQAKERKVIATNASLSLSGATTFR